jgi:hypothetical protein
MTAATGVVGGGEECVSGYAGDDEESRGGRIRGVIAGEGTPPTLSPSIACVAEASMTKSSRGGATDAGVDTDLLSI